DIYSLGVVLYELLCGALPLSRHDDAHGDKLEFVRRIREVEPTWPSTRIASSPDSAEVAARRRLDGPKLEKQLRGDLDWVVMKCLEKERDRRYAAAQGLAADLERFLREEPVLAAPPSTSYRLKKFARRHRGKLAVLSLALLLLIAAVVATTVGWVRAARAERV